MPREPSKIMRQNPLPPGRYWIAIQEEMQPAWLDLQARNKGALQVDHEECQRRAGASMSQKGDCFYIFYVTAPLAWPTGLGTPNTAPDWVQQQTDVTFKTPTAAKILFDDSVDWLEQNVSPGLAITWKVVLFGAGLYYLATHQGKQ